MRLFISPLLLSLLAVTAVNAASLQPRTVQKCDGDTSGRYIVKFKDGISRSSALAGIEHRVNITHDWEFINSFAGHLDDAALNALLASPDVEYVSEDVIAEESAIQYNAPWGLSRISSARTLYNTDARNLNYPYRYCPAAGAGVDVYNEFGGRAIWGATFGGHAIGDRRGHGTHVAGTVGGRQFGVAKAARIIAVKVLGDNGKGATSDIISGMNWVRSRVIGTPRPSVVCMSLGGPANKPMDYAVAALTSVGIHVVVSAGNDNADAVLKSPARARSAITVGATTIGDVRAPYSNYGGVVDIFAPGSDVLSAGLRNRNDVTSKSGTSMATPHVAGLVAYLISREGNTTPAAMKARLQVMALRRVIEGLPSGTVNLLAQNGHKWGWLSGDDVEQSSVQASVSESQSEFAMH
ncbi:serine protease [Pholiota molesta]|nr:serine protease [Pholiota molesta]